MKEKNFEKIDNLIKALNDIGIHTEVDYQTEWYCLDNKVHYGIEISTDMNYGEDCWSFCFSPNGKYIKSCLDAPIMR